MGDIRSLDITATDRGIKTNTLLRNNEALTAGSANTNEYFGFFVNAVGGAWSYTPIDGKAAIAFTPQASTFYPYHVSSITPHASGTGDGDLGGFRKYLSDAISSWTLTGTSTTTNNILTVAVGDSADLDTGSSVFPVVGATYKYEYTITQYTSATKALFTYGGVDFYDKAAAGTYTGTLTATAATDLEIDIDVVATDDFIMTGLKIERV